MTKGEWLSSTDAAAMLLFIACDGSGPGEGPNRVPMSDRKLRLFCCGCLARSDQALLRNVDRYGEFDYGEDGEKISNPLGTAQAWASPEAYDYDPPAATKAALLRCIAGNPFAPVTLPLVRIAGTVAITLEGVEMYRRPDGTYAPALQCPWLTPQVVALAECAYGERPRRECERCKGCGSDRRIMGLPATCPACDGAGRIEDGSLDRGTLCVLADALEDGGCDDEAILRHLRGEEGPCPYRGALAHSLACHWCDGNIWRPLRGPCVRGCHVLDLLLGKG